MFLNRRQDSRAGAFRGTRVCVIVVALTASTARAQIAASWQATTASTWSTNGACAAPEETSGRVTGSSETVGGRLRSSGDRRASLEVSGDLAVGDRNCTARHWSGSAGVRAAFEAHGIWTWVAYSASNAASPDTAVRRVGLSAGLERRFGPTLLSMSVGPRRDRLSTQRVVQLTERLSPEKVYALPGTTVVQETTLVADTSTRPGNRRIPDLGIALSWTHRALGIDGAAHFGLAGESRRVDPLARVQLSYDLSRRVAAIAGVVSRGAVRSLDIPAGNVASLGFRIHGGIGRGAPNASRPTASAADFRADLDIDGQLNVAVRAPAAHRVEVAGDLTHWEPMQLRATNDGWWRGRLRSAPGAHQVSIRLDGARWIAPPGLPRVRDEFGSTVGLLIVQ